MRIFFISPIGLESPMLFSTFISTFQREGHVIVNEVGEADVVFFDLHNRHGGYNVNDLNTSLTRKLPLIIWDAWDYGGTIDETSEWLGNNDWEVLSRIQNCQWATFIKMALVNGNKMVWFVRKMDKNVSYQPFVHPYELIMYPHYDFPAVSQDELFNREYDFCFVGNYSPTRKNICTELSKHFKCDFLFPEQRLPHNQWLDRHRNAKFFIECCGGGFGSERPYQLYAIAPMCKVNNSQVILNDFEDCFDCVKVDEIPTKLDFEKIRTVLNSTITLYSLYIRGMQRMGRYFNADYRSNYILETLKKEGII